MVHDAQGHALSGADGAVARAYDEAARALVQVHGDALGGLDAVIQAALRCAMAHLAKGWAFILANDLAALAQARTIVETVRAMPLNERERAHLAALAQATQGARASAVAT